MGCVSGVSSGCKIVTRNVCFLEYFFLPWLLLCPSFLEQIRVRVKNPEMHKPQLPSHSPGETLDNITQLKEAPAINNRWE